MISGWSAEAFNQSPDSANQIHGDEIAQKFGFKGGLVPGVTVSAYLTHPGQQAWGMEFLQRGHAHVRVASPLYDEEMFDVAILTSSDTDYTAELRRPDGTKSATAEVSLAHAAPPAPKRRGDPVAANDFVGADASPERWAELQENGCHAYRFVWNEKHRMATYVRDGGLMPTLLSGDNAFANMGYILGTSNWILAGNAHMNPWVHLETESQNYAPVALNTALIAEMQVDDFYEKKGHRFVDASIALFNEANDECAATIKLRAIYRLRGL